MCQTACFNENSGQTQGLNVYLRNLKPKMEWINTVQKERGRKKDEITLKICIKLYIFNWGFISIHLFLLNLII